MPVVHIFKHPTNGLKGIICFTHKEMRDIENYLTPVVKDRYFVGIHFGGSTYRTRLPDVCDFFMGRESVIQVGSSSDALRIPLASANFTPRFFCRANHPKYWDIINVSRNNPVKRLDDFMVAVRRIYDAGYPYRVLLICHTRIEEREDAGELTERYYGMFNREERQLFTLLRLGADLHYLGLSQTQIAFFFQASKVSTLFSTAEGSPKVLAESLLCGVPVVVYRGLKGSGRDFLTCANSIEFSDYSTAHDALIEAVEKVNDFRINEERIADAFCEDKTKPKLLDYFELLYLRHGCKFDRSLINMDELNLRLPAHIDEGLPWISSHYTTSDLRTAEQWQTFLDSLQLR